jgi:hypothetical protein
MRILTRKWEYTCRKGGRELEYQQGKRGMGRSEGREGNGKIERERKEWED